MRRFVGPTPKLFDAGEFGGEGIAVDDDGGWCTVCRDRIESVRIMGTPCQATVPKVAVATNAASEFFVAILIRL